MAAVHRAAYESIGVEVVENDPDIVSICTPDFLHGQQVIDALSARCHVMCEKPLCTTVEELDQIEAMTDGLKICVNYPLRFHPPFLALTKYPESFYVEYFYGRKHKLESGWRSLSGYSQVMGGMIHMVDLVCFKTSRRMEPISVTSENDRVVAEVALDDGIQGTVISDFSAPEGHHHYVEWGDGLTIINRNESDKQREIVNFIQHIKSKDIISAWSNYDYFHPTRTCLEIDRMARIDSQG